MKTAGAAMNKPFTFGDGQAAGGAKLDARLGKRPAIWTRDDLNYAVRAYCKTHTQQQAVEIFYHCCRVMRPGMVPSYAFGAVIGMMAQELTGRPWAAEASHTPPTRRDDI